MEKEECSELIKKGFKLGLDKVRRLMKKLGLVAKRPKQHVYPRGGKSSILASNHLNRQFNPATINRYWSGDITYIRTRQGSHPLQQTPCAAS